MKLWVKIKFKHYIRYITQYVNKVVCSHQLVHQSHLNPDNRKRTEWRISANVRIYSGVGWDFEAQRHFARYTKRNVFCIYFPISQFSYLSLASLWTLYGWCQQWQKIKQTQTPISFVLCVLLMIWSSTSVDISSIYESKMYIYRT